MYNSDKIQKEIYAVLCNLTAEEVANAIISYNGLQILTSDFAQFLIDDGLASESEFTEEF